MQSAVLIKKALLVFSRVSTARLFLLQSELVFLLPSCARNFLSFHINCNFHDSRFCVFACHTGIIFSKLAWLWQPEARLRSCSLITTLFNDSKTGAARNLIGFSVAVSFDSWLRVVCEFMWEILIKIFLRHFYSYLSWAVYVV